MVSLRSLLVLFLLLVSVGAAASAAVVSNSTLTPDSCVGAAASAAFVSTSTLTPGSCVGDGRALMEIHAPAGSTWAGMGPWGWFYGVDANGNPNMLPVDPSGISCIIADVCGYRGGQWRIIVKLPGGTTSDSGIFDMSQQPAVNNAACYYSFDATGGTPPTTKVSVVSEEVITKSNPAVMYDTYRIRITLQNPSADQQIPVSITSDESGGLPEYGDKLSPPKVANTIIPAGGIADVAFEYNHSWRWLKTMEDWRKSLGSFGAIENMLKVVLPKYSQMAGEGFQTASDVLTVSQLIDSKPTAVYTYHFTSSNVIGFSDKTVTIYPTAAKIASLGGGISLPLGAVWFSTNGVEISLLGGPESVAAAGFCAIIGEAISFKIADDSLVLAFDPDQNYQEPVYLVPIHIPKIDKMPDNPMKDLVITYEKAASHRIAFDRTMAKYYGAIEAQDNEWATKQLIAANYYLDLLKNDYLTLKPQTESAVKYLKEDLKISFTEQDIEHAKEQMRTQGLPAEEANLLRQFGYTDADLDAIVAINLMVPNDEIINYDQSMVTNIENQLNALDWMGEELQTNMDSAQFVDAQVSIRPKVLNLNSRPKWVIASIKVPGYSINEIDVSSITLNGVIPASVEKKMGSDGKNKIKGEKSSSLLVRFDRKQVLKMVEPGKALFVITGKVADKQFKASEFVTIRTWGRPDYREDEHED
jgi:hypothetical protein